MSFDSVGNFVYSKVKNGYDENATSIELETGWGNKFPDPAVNGEYNLVWWNEADFRDPSRIQNPASSSDVEIVRCKEKNGDVLTIERAQEGTIAGIKNQSGKFYSVCLSVTAKTINDLKNIAEKDKTSNEIKKQLANQQAVFNKNHNAVLSSRYFYDLYDESNDLSMGKIDNTKTTLSSNVSAGSNIINVTDATGLHNGTEITIQDSLNLERKVIKVIDGTAITLEVSVTNNFMKDAVVYRSLPKANNSLLKFTGYITQKTFSVLTPVKNIRN